MNIPQPRFLLKEPKSKSDTLIYVHIRFSKERVVYSSGEKILPTQWDTNKQRAINSKRYPEHTELNLWLDKLDTTIKSIFRNFNIDGITPTTQLVREKLNEKLNNKPSRKKNLFEFIETYIQESEKVKNINTTKTYKTTFHHLQAFSKHHQQKLNYGSITLEFYNKFLDYLTNEKQLSHNTIGKHIQILKTLLNEATDRGLNEKLDFRSRKFKRPYEEVEGIYLKKSELEKLHNLDLVHKPNLERVRDLFLIGCHTGLRYSDFSQILPSNITSNKAGKFLTVRTLKTDEKVVIPLNPKVQKILAQYDNHIPKPLSNQKMNFYIKKVCKQAEINEPILITRTKGGIKTRNTHSKFELVTTHTARRTFASNAFLGGVPTIAIMAITGHKTDKEFMKYIKIGKEENALILQNHSFFNGK